MIILYLYNLYTYIYKYIYMHMTYVLGCIETCTIVMNMIKYILHVYVCNIYILIAIYLSVYIKCLHPCWQ